MKLSREFKTGIFGIAMIACLYWGINFLRGRDLFSLSNTYYAEYDQINGLQKSSNVFIKGFKVGSVTDMTYQPEKSDKVILQMNIKRGYRIPVNSSARIFNDGLMGGKAIEIILGDSPEYLSVKDTLMSIIDKDLLEVAGNEFEFLKQRVDQVSKEMITALHNINSLLENNNKSMNATINNMASISDNLNSVISSQSENLKSIISNINTLSTELKNNSQGINNIVDNVENFTDSLNRSGIITSLDQSLNQLDLTLNKLNSTDGTLGNLINDATLYDSLVSATSNLSKLFDDIKQHPERYVRISVFGKKSKQNN